MNIQIEVLEGVVPVGAGLDRTLMGVEVKRRGCNRDDYYEGWVNPDILPDGLLDKMNKHAATYARDVLDADADAASAVIHNVYWTGHSCPDHVDQYSRRNTGSTMNRTVSASLIVECAGRGGEMVMQDPDRRRDAVVVNPDAGTLILFPADWWHQVRPVRSGIRRSLVRWWAQSSGGTFSSRSLI